MIKVEYNIRPARLGDYEQIAEILKKAEHYDTEVDSLEVFQRSLNNPEECPFVAVVGEKIVGTMAKVAQFGGYGYQGRFAVNPHYQRQGIGDALSIAAEKFLRSRGAKRFFVLIHDNNIVSADFATKHGYRKRSHFLYDKKV
jgi:predicted N-acetyltransferase YhbS